jgi:hypothetical protein
VLQRLAGTERQVGAAEDANAVENEQEQSAIESRATAPSAEPFAEAVDRGNATISFTAESPESRESSTPSV